MADGTVTISEVTREALAEKTEEIQAAARVALTFGCVSQDSETGRFFVRINIRNKEQWEH